MKMFYFIETQNFSYLKLRFSVTFNRCIGINSKDICKAWECDLCQFYFQATNFKF